MRLFPLLPIQQISHGEISRKDSNSQKNFQNISEYAHDLFLESDRKLICPLLDCMIKTALSNPNQYRILLLDSICLLECAVKAQYVEVLEPSRYISYARLYFEQCKLSGVSFPVHYIQNAKYFFEKHFDHYPKWKISDDYIEYLRVLIILGEYNLAVQVIQCVLSIFEREEDAANYLFYAGCIHKRLNDFNRANHYFFQSIELGPPKLFSKLEMMVILSRVIEDEKAEAELTNENDSAYQMVHTQFVIEGELHDSLDYEDWIGSYQTWFTIGQKCAVHGMHSLAREFYMLGISQDRTAFHQANLWFAFAKACFRSGRNDEAKLAIRQAIRTATPANLSQMERIEKRWNQREKDFNVSNNSITSLLSSMSFRAALDPDPVTDDNLDKTDLTDISSTSPIFSVTSLLSPRRGSNLVISPWFASVSPRTKTKQETQKQQHTSLSSEKVQAAFESILKDILQHVEDLQEIGIVKFQAIVRGKLLWKKRLSRTLSGNTHRK